MAVKLKLTLAIAVQNKKKNDLQNYVKRANCLSGTHSSGNWTHDCTYGCYWMINAEIKAIKYLGLEHRETLFSLQT